MLAVGNVNACCGVFLCQCFDDESDGERQAESKLQLRRRLVELGDCLDALSLAGKHLFTILYCQWETDKGEQRPRAFASQKHHYQEPAIWHDDFENVDFDGF